MKHYAACIKNEWKRMEIECAVKNSVTDKRVDGIDEDNWCEVFMN